MDLERRSRTAGTSNAASVRETASKLTSPAATSTASFVDAHLNRDEMGFLTFAVKSLPLTFTLSSAWETVASVSASRPPLSLSMDIESYDESNGHKPGRRERRPPGIREQQRARGDNDALRIEQLMRLWNAPRYSM